MQDSEGVTSKFDRRQAAEIKKKKKRDVFEKREDDDVSVFEAAWREALNRAEKEQDKTREVVEDKKPQYVVGREFINLGDESRELAEFLRPVGEYFIHLFDGNEALDNTLTSDQVKKYGLPEDFEEKILSPDQVKKYGLPDEFVNKPITREQAGKYPDLPRELVSKQLRWEDLGHLEEKDFERVWVEVMRDLCRDLAIHGNFNREGRLLCFSDMDGYGAKMVAEMAGLKINGTKWHFVEKGDVYGVKESVDTINFDTSKDPDASEGVRRGIEGSYLQKVEVGLEGGEKKVVYVLMFDHHAPHSNEETSATRAAYTAFCKMGLLERSESMDRFVEVVTRLDNGLLPGELPANSREFFAEHYAETVWGAYDYMGAGRATKLKSFLDKGGDPMAILSESEKRKMGLIFTAENKGEETNNYEKLQGMVDRCMARLQELEANQKIAEVKGYGRIVVDEGGLMGTVGSDAAMACGYDGYLSWNEEKKSFVLFTKKKMKTVLDVGIKVRDHMWMLKADDGEKDDITLEKLLNQLANGKRVRWMRVLPERKEIPEENKRVEVHTEPETQGAVWYEGMGNDLEILLDGLNHGLKIDQLRDHRISRESVRRLEELNGFDLTAFINSASGQDWEKIYQAVAILNGEYGSDEELSRRPGWMSAEAALSFLKNKYGIARDGTPGADKETGAIPHEVAPKNNEQRESQVKVWEEKMLRLPDEDEMGVNKILFQLEFDGLKIGDYFKAMGEAGHGREAAVMHLRNMALLHRLTPEQRKDFGTLMENYRSFEEILGLKWYN